MEGILRTLCENPLIAVAVCFAALLILYFLFKSLIKLAMILLIVAAVIVGYFYFQNPESRPTSFRDAVEKARTGAGRAVDQGKEAYEKGRDLVEKGRGTYEKGKELVEKGKEVLDRGIDKAKDAVETR